MKCPECGTKTEQVKTSSHYGVPIVIDQCRECGGIWFDKSELYRTKMGAAQKLKKLANIEKLKKCTSSSNKKLKCPRDGSEMQTYKDQYPFPGIEVETCPECNGFWFNCSEFVQYQDKRVEKRKQDKQAQLEIKNRKEAEEKYSRAMINLLKLYEAERQRNERARDFRNTETFLETFLSLTGQIFRASLLKK